MVGVWIHHSPVGLGRLSGQQCFVIIAHILSCSQQGQVCSAGSSSQLLLTWIWLYELSDTKGEVFCHMFTQILLGLSYINLLPAFLLKSLSNGVNYLLHFLFTPLPSLTFIGQCSGCCHFSPSLRAAKASQSDLRCTFYVRRDVWIDLRAMWNTLKSYF